MISHAHRFVVSVESSPNDHQQHPVLRRSGRVLSSSSKEDLLKGIDMEKIERMRSPSPRSRDGSSTPSRSPDCIAEDVEDGSIEDCGSTDNELAGISDT